MSPPVFCYIAILDDDDDAIGKSTEDLMDPEQVLL